MTPLQRIIHLFRPDKKEIRNIYVYAIFNGLINLSLPLGIQAIINQIQSGQVTTSWLILVLVVVAGVAFAGILQIYQIKVTEQLQQKLMVNAAFEFAWSLPKIKWQNWLKHSAPEMMNKFMDIVSIQKGMSKILLDFSSATLQVFFGLVLLSLYHPFFFIFSILLLFIIYLIFRTSFKRGLESSILESKAKYKILYWLEQVANNLSHFKLRIKYHLHLKKTDEYAAMFLKHRRNHFNVVLRQFTYLVLFKILVTSILLIIGGFLVLNQQMNIGQFVAAEIIILLIMTSIEKVILNLETIYDVLTSADKMGQVTDLELEDTDGMKFSESKCDQKGISLNIQNLSFYYHKGHYIFKDLNVHVQPGSVNVVSSDSFGKSTFIKLISGLLKPQKGIVTANKIDVEQWCTYSYQDHIGLYWELTDLFEASLMENIRMGNPNIEHAHLLQLLEELGWNEFWNECGLHFDSPIAYEGNNLSGSTKKKIKLIRCLIQKPELLIIDEDFYDFKSDEKESLSHYLFEQYEGTLVFVSNAILPVPNHANIIKL